MVGIALRRRQRVYACAAVAVLAAILANCGPRPGSTTALSAAVAPQTAREHALPAGCKISPLEAFTQSGKGHLASQRIAQFEAQVSNCRLPGREEISWVGLRRVTREDGAVFRTVVDPEDLTPALIDEACLSCLPVGQDGAPNTAHETLLATLQNRVHPLQNDGIQRSAGSPDGVFLSIDLCPGGFDRALFEKIGNEQATGPVPVAIAVSGLWAQVHLKDLQWLRDEELRGRLKITWVNHSATHPYLPDRAMTQNFLLTNKGLFDSEILPTEQKLLQNGIVPSAFFRFPGLVSNAKWIDHLKTLGLVALGADAWLGKNQKPRPGSIILIHGNGNEPMGTERFFRWMNSKERLPFLDLREIVAPSAGAT